MICYFGFMGVRILWLSPLPPVRSGVSDYAVEILRPLSQLATVRILSPPSTVEAPELPDDLAGFLVPNEATPEENEIIVAHFGNNPYHSWILDRCNGRRTVGVVHDLVLHHLLVHRTLSAPGEFKASMKSAYPNAGGALADARELGLTGRLDPFLFPALEPLLGGMEALVCHSEFGKRRLVRDFPKKRILEMKLPVADPGPVDRWEIRKKLGVNPDEIVLMHLGFLTPEKGLAPILGGLAAARRSGVRARLILVGDAAGDEELQVAAKRLGIEDSVTSTGWLEWQEMTTVAAAADLGIVLRVPSAGETSAAVVRFLACGTPCAVIAQRQFLEWAPEVAPRITPGPPMTAEVARLLRHVSEDQSWEGRRSAARAAYQADHRPERAAETMVRFLADLG
jgi:glycosyltransferase involved in cell wall biosynthesis